MAVSIFFPKTNKIVKLRAAGANVADTGKAE